METVLLDWTLSGMSIDSQFIKLENGKRVKEYWMANDSDPKDEKNSG